MCVWFVCVCMCVCVRACVCVCVCVRVCACLCASFPRYIFYTVERDLHSVLRTVGRSLHVYVRACTHAYACISSSVIFLPTCVQFMSELVCTCWYTNSSDYLYVSCPCRHILIHLLRLPVCIFSLYAHVDTSTPLITCIYLLPNVACVGTCLSRC